MSFINILGNALGHLYSLPSRPWGISCIYIVRQYGSDSSWVRKGLGPIRLGSEKIWVRVVPEILGPSRLGSELSDILIGWP